MHVSSLIPTGEALDVRIRGSEAAVALIVQEGSVVDSASYRTLVICFMLSHARGLADNGANLQPANDDDGKQLFRLEKWGQLPHLLKACRAAMAEDSSLVLGFSPLLSQDNRQHIHKCALTLTSEGMTMSVADG